MRIAVCVSLLLTGALQAQVRRKLDGLAVSFAAEIQQSAHLAFSTPEEYPEILNSF